MLRAHLVPLVMAVALGATGCDSQPASPSNAGQKAPDASLAAGGRAATGAVVYVTSQGLYYDTFVAQDPLPMQGKFQLLADGRTEFGPGDAGYLGGRWWEDSNGNGVQDPDDHYFLCPLLPPGRETP
jgi:hypothetical protein